MKPVKMLPRPATYRRSKLQTAVLILVLGAVLLFATATFLNLMGEDALRDSAAITDPSAKAQQIKRGEYLARAGNCISCHTARGGEAYAGGFPLETPFGTIYGPNLTPDTKTGIGSWSSAEFWRAMHNGRSKDGRLLYPAFPYPNFTEVTREDSDAIYAWFKTIPAVEQQNKPNELRFPYSTQLAVGFWRALFFRPATFEADKSKSVDWNRGAYLVRGLGHCAACHAPRNALGATISANSSQSEFGGGLIPVQNWYAPSLNSPDEAGVAHWTDDEVLALLKTGLSSRGSVMGPMAEVVFNSTQYLDAVDLNAMAVFLKELPQQNSAPIAAEYSPTAQVLTRGELIYNQQCAQCHGDKGEGKAGAWPALAGNRAVNMQNATNVVRVVLSGGFLPATAGNPRPFGMPPFAHVLDDSEIAAVSTYVRRSFGNDAPPVSTAQVFLHREGRVR